MGDDDRTLALAVAQLCAEAEGNYRRPRVAFLRNIRAMLPAAHPAAVLDDYALEAAMHGLRQHLADTYRVDFRRSADPGRRVRLTSRLIRRYRPAA
ncbi:hypothetical protein OG836_26160 [Micromonospora zamorensis]|uniref:hypothetical protein n=1 Tax=Micromonospora zamorensis TaxID=709883 RepID=UPI002E1F3563